MKPRGQFREKTSRTSHCSKNPIFQTKTFLLELDSANLSPPIDILFFYRMELTEGRVLPNLS